MSVDGNGRYCYLDPYRGAMLAVAEAARNVACAGGAAARRDQLPELRQSRAAEIMWQFAQAVEGIGEACRALDMPITGGNVSLYNETDGSAIYPTPVIGVVGLLEHADRVVEPPVPASRATRSCCSATDRGELGGSEYLKVVHGLVRGVPPALDLDAERALQTLLVDAGGRAADALGARLLRRRPRGDARRVLLRHRRHRRRRRRSTASTVARDAGVNDRGDAVRRIGVARRRLGRAGAT